MRQGSYFFSIRLPSVLPMIIFPISQRSVIVIMFKSFNLHQFNAISIKCQSETTFHTCESCCTSVLYNCLWLRCGKWTTLSMPLQRLLTEDFVINIFVEATCQILNIVVKKQKLNHGIKFPSP